jgi:DNA polymerase III psi subunit
MYIEKNTTALQQLFAGENIYLLKDEFVSESSVETQTTPLPTLLSVSSQTTATLSMKTQTTTQENIPQENPIQYYQPKQKVIVLVTSLNPTDSELLGKILGAVKLDLQSVDVIELDKNQDINLSQIFTQKSVNHIVTFGIDSSKVGLDIKLTPYQILEKQGIKFIYSDSLPDIQNDIPKKKALWGSLKEMF